MIEKLKCVRRFCDLDNNLSWTEQNIKNWVESYKGTYPIINAGRGICMIGISGCLIGATAFAATQNPFMLILALESAASFCVGVLGCLINSVELENYIRHKEALARYNKLSKKQNGQNPKISEEKEI